MVAAHIEFGQSRRGARRGVVSPRTATRSSTATGAARSGRSTSSSARPAPAGGVRGEDPARRRLRRAGARGRRRPSSSACAGSPRPGWPTHRAGRGTSTSASTSSRSPATSSTSTRTPSDPDRATARPQPASAQTSEGDGDEQAGGDEHVVERTGPEPPVRVVAHAASIAGCPPSVLRATRAYAGDRDQAIRGAAGGRRGARRALRRRRPGGTGAAGPPAARRRPGRLSDPAVARRRLRRHGRRLRLPHRALPRRPGAGRRHRPVLVAAASSTSATASTPSTSTRATSTSSGRCTTRTSSRCGRGSQPEAPTFGGDEIIGATESDLECPERRRPDAHDAHRRLVDRLRCAVAVLRQSRRPAALAARAGRRRVRSPSSPSPPSGGSSPASVAASSRSPAPRRSRVRRKPRSATSGVGRSLRRRRAAARATGARRRNGAHARRLGWAAAIQGCSARNVATHVAPGHRAVACG